MDLDTALREHFGFAAFRPGQRDACFTGEYPLDGTDGKANGKFALEGELPLVRA